MIKLKGHFPVKTLIYLIFDVADYISTVQIDRYISTVPGKQQRKKLFGDND